MALRVLLADESTTIKKVMQLALQDFAVEVKAVHAGVDVVDVARSFQPDIIFADVLLQKKNGYEVCALLKADAELKTIPVVLMWSSFMDLDDALARSSGADGRLEKPFDVETLRKQLLELVPKTRSQRLAHFLDYPAKLNDELKAEAGPSAAPSAPRPVPAAPQPPTPGPRAAAAPPPPPTQSPAGKSAWTMESFADPSSFADAPEDEEFQPLELSRLDRPVEPEPFRPDTAAKIDLTPASATEDEAWSRHDLSQFKLELPAISVGEGDQEFKLDMGERDFAAPEFELEPETHIRPPSTHAPPRPSPQSAEAGDDSEPSFGPDLTLDASEINDATEEIALPIEPLGFDSSPGFGATPPSPPLIPQLSADRLEEIIRAQSREIIESVVRKMVPDLASSIIREELERLLEDTAVRESSREARKDSRT